MKRSRRTLGAAFVAVLAVVAASCGDDDKAATPVTSTPAETGATSATPAETVATSAPTTTAAGPTTTDAPSPTVFDPELVKKAQEEGEVNFSTAVHSGTLGPDLVAAFEEQFGITVNLAVVVTADIVTQIQAEASAGRHSIDIVGIPQASALLAGVDEMGLIRRVDVPAADNFVEGSYSESDPGVPIFLNPINVLYNTEKTPNPPTSYAELAERGNMTIGNVATSGGALSLMYTLEQTIGVDETAKLLNGVTRVLDSPFGAPPLVMSGEVEFMLASAPQIQVTLVAQGEPSGQIYMSEVIPSVISNVALLENAPHPFAAELLMQYITSREGQLSLVAGGATSIYPDLPAPEVEGITGFDVTKIKLVDPKAVAAARDGLIERFNAATGQG